MGRLIVNETIFLREEDGWIYHAMIYDMIFQIINLGEGWGEFSNTTAVLNLNFEYPKASA